MLPSNPYMLNHLFILYYMYRTTCRVKIKFNFMFMVPCIIIYSMK